KSSRPRPSSLFPYTTLFRSRPGCAGHRLSSLTRPWNWGLMQHLIGCIVGAYVLLSLFQSSAGMVTGAIVGGLTSLSLQLRKQVRDRKSTRLNSSHVKISYAV